MQLEFLQNSKILFIFSKSKPMKVCKLNTVKPTQYEHTVYIFTYQSLYAPKKHLLH